MEKQYKKVVWFETYLELQIWYFESVIESPLLDENRKELYKKELEFFTRAKNEFNKF